MSYQEMDQTAWVCYQFPEDQAYYYGEVGYLDEAGLVHPKDNQEAANNPSNKLVKHGFGVYLFNAGAAKPSKYEGQWDRDRKHGKGKLTVPGEFKYEGTFRQGAYHQQGRMQWERGDVYEGKWKRNRMQGAGVFRHHEGFVLKGSFRANYFIEEGLLRNPLMGQKEFALFKKQVKEVNKQKQRNQKVKSGFVAKLPQAQLLQSIKKSNSNNRVPFVIASEEAKFNVATLEKTLGVDKKVYCFDLRKAYLLKGEERYAYKQSFAEMTRAALTQGAALIINLDQSQNPFPYAFYPDLKEFYDSAGFNSSTWSRETMKRPEVHARVTGGKIADDYLLVVWSKIKLGEGLQEEQIREKLQMRFESILPFIKLDIVMCVSP